MKPLNQKAYGSIPHLPISKMGQGDKRINAGQAKMMLEKKRDKHDEIIVQEKLDGSCVSVARVNGELIALVRAGYLASSSEWEHHKDFNEWFILNKERFEFIEENYRVVGEWIATPHGTIYNFNHDPFVAFDYMTGTERVNYDVFCEKTKGLTIAALIHRGEAYGLHNLFWEIYKSRHGADQMEGAVYRLERDKKVQFLAKFVRPDFEPSKFLKRKEV